MARQSRITGGKKDIKEKKDKKGVNAEIAKGVYKQAINDIAEKVVLLGKEYNDDKATEMFTKDMANITSNLRIAVENDFIQKGDESKVIDGISKKISEKISEKIRKSAKEGNVPEPSKGFIRNIVNLIRETFRKAANYRASKKSEDVTKALNKGFMIDKLSRENFKSIYLDQHDALLEFKNSLKSFIGKEELIDVGEKSVFNVLYDENRIIDLKYMEINNELDVAKQALKTIKEKLKTTEENLKATEEKFQFAEERLKIIETNLEGAIEVAGKTAEDAAKSHHEAFDMKLILNTLGSVNEMMIAKQKGYGNVINKEQPNKPRFNVSNAKFIALEKLADEVVKQNSGKQNKNR